MIQGVVRNTPRLSVSMLFTALIMRPWVLMAKARGCLPRILADDIMLIAKGKGAIRRFASVLNLSHQYLLDMGAKIAHGKSINFASTKTARTWLAETAWDLAGGAIKVVEHMRYLGGHISTGAKRHNTTLSGRGKNGQTMARKVDRLPVDRKKKAAIIRAKVIPASLYGIRQSDRCHHDRHDRSRLQEGRGLGIPSSIIRR